MRVLQYLADWPSPNFETRAALLKRRGHQRVPRLIVLHTTEGTYPSDIDWLCKDRGEKSVSCHVYIRRNGDVYKVVSFEDVAWHAGVARSERTNRPDLWALWGDYNVNWDAIGIEMEAAYNRSVTEEQMVSLVQVVKDLLNRYPTIKPDRRHVVGHYELKKSKIDPPRFDWPRFNRDVGLSP